MRIALVAGPYAAVPPHQYGGIEQVIYYLVKGLQELGHEPVLLATADSRVECELIPIADKALLFAKSKAEEAGRQKTIQAVNRRIAAILHDIAPRVDIVHSHGYDLSKFTAKPTVTTLHNRFTLDMMGYYETRRDLPYVSISRNQRRAFPDLNYVATVYNGEDPRQFPIVKNPQPYVCFLGRFDRDKNPHLAIELAIKLGVKIKVAGKIDLKGEGYFDEYVAKYFGHPHVEYLGELGFEDKIDLLGNAMCNFHPTGFREPFGLTVLEAAYCGTPTLAINRGAMPEVIQHGRTGMLVEDYEEGYHAAEECFTMNRAYIAARARRKFQYKKMTRQYLYAYGAVIYRHSLNRGYSMLREQSLGLGLLKHKPSAI